MKINITGLPELGTISISEDDLKSLGGVNELNEIVNALDTITFAGKKGSVRQGKLPIGLQTETKRTGVEKILTKYEVEIRWGKDKEGNETITVIPQKLLKIRSPQDLDEIAIQIKKWIKNKCGLDQEQKIDITFPPKGPPMQITFPKKEEEEEEISAEVIKDLIICALTNADKIFNEKDFTLYQLQPNVLGIGGGVKQLLQEIALSENLSEKVIPVENLVIPEENISQQDLNKIDILEDVSEERNSGEDIIIPEENISQQELNEIAIPIRKWIKEQCYLEFEQNVDITLSPKGPMQIIFPPEISAEVMRDLIISALKNAGKFFDDKDFKISPSQPHILEIDGKAKQSLQEIKPPKKVLTFFQSDDTKKPETIFQERYAGIFIEFFELFKQVLKKQKSAMLPFAANLNIQTVKIGDAGDISFTFKDGNLKGKEDEMINLINSFIQGTVGNKKNYRDHIKFSADDNTVQMRELTPPSLLLNGEIRDYLKALQKKELALLVSCRDSFDALFKGDFSQPILCVRWSGLGHCRIIFHPDVTETQAKDCVDLFLQSFTKKQGNYGADLSFDTKSNTLTIKDAAYEIVREKISTLEEWESGREERESNQHMFDNLLYTMAQNTPTQQARQNRMSRG